MTKERIENFGEKWIFCKESLFWKCFKDVLKNRGTLKKEGMHHWISGMDASAHKRQMCRWIFDNQRSI